MLDAGKRYLDTGQYQRAKHAYQQARAVGWGWPGAAQFGLDKATLYDAGKLPDIAQRLATLLAQHPNDAHLHLLQGDVHAQQQAYEPASATYQRAIALDPNLVQAHYSLALVSAHLGNLDQAMALAERAATLDAWRPAYVLLLASYYVQRQDYTRAETLYQQTLQRHRTLVLTYVDLANSHRARGQFAEARDYLA